MIATFLLSLAAAANQPALAGGPLPAVRARADLGALISDRDYPREALQRREQGRVAFELTVAPQGQVADCRILASSGSATLDDATCRIMRERARFAPARDAEGRATADIVRDSIRWELIRPLVLIDPRWREPRLIATRQPNGR
jgi:protein TonB